MLGFPYQTFPSIAEFHLERKHSSSDVNRTRYYCSYYICTITLFDGRYENIRSSNLYVATNVNVLRVGSIQLSCGVYANCQGLLEDDSFMVMKRYVSTSVFVPIYVTVYGKFVCFVGVLSWLEIIELKRVPGAGDRIVATFV